MADKGGGIENLGGVTASNTIIADNTSTVYGPPDCAGPLTSNGYNLTGSSSDGCFSSGTGDIVADPLLGPLTDNPPGLNATQAPLAGSPAIGVGARTVCGYADPVAQLQTSAASSASPAHAISAPTSRSARRVLQASSP